MEFLRGKEWSGSDVSDDVFIPTHTIRYIKPHYSGGSHLILSDGISVIVDMPHLDLLDLLVLALPGAHIGAELNGAMVFGDGRSTVYEGNAIVEYRQRYQ